MGRWALLGLVAGCYHPTIPSGAPCETSDECPSSQACVGNVCGGTGQVDAGPGLDAGDAAPLDGPVDAPIDAPIMRVVIGDDPAELRDTSLQGASPNLILGDQDHMSVDDSETSLVWFDLTTIAPTRTVISATLRVPVTDAASAVGTVTLHRLRERWTESGANWLSRTASLTWTTTGARSPSSDQAAVASFSPAALATSYDVVLPPALVQAWIADPAVNFGIMFARGTATEHVHLGTRETSTRCQLTLDLY